MTLIKYGKVMKKAKTMNRYNHVARLTGYYEGNTTHKRVNGSVISQQVTTRLQGTDKTVYKGKREK